MDLILLNSICCYYNKQELHKLFCIVDTIWFTSVTDSFCIISTQLSENLDTLYIKIDPNIIPLERMKALKNADKKMQFIELCEAIERNIKERTEMLEYYNNTYEVVDFMKD